MMKILLIIALVASVPSGASLLKKLLLKKAIAAKLGISTPFLLRSLLTGESLLPGLGSIVADIVSPNGGANEDPEVAHLEVDDSAVPEPEPESEPLGESETEKAPNLPSEESSPSYYFVPVRQYTIAYPYPYAYSQAYPNAEPRYFHGTAPSW